MAVLGEMTIVFTTDDLKSEEEAKRHLNKDLLVMISSYVESVTGFKGKLKALDVTELKIYDDVI